MRLYDTPKAKLLRILNVIAVFVILFSSSMEAQDLSTYQWENRLLLMITNGQGSSLEKQVEEIRRNEEGLSERKMKTLLLTAEGYYLGPHFDELTSAPELLDHYASSDSGFEMLLIGLDGGVKRRYKKEEPLELIFAVIDAMPMRRTEIKRKGQ